MTIDSDVIYRDWREYLSSAILIREIVASVVLPFTLVTFLVGSVTRLEKLKSLNQVERRIFDTEFWKKSTLKSPIIWLEFLQRWLNQLRKSNMRFVLVFSVSLILLGE